MWKWIKCRIFASHDWKTSRIIYTNDLDDVYETCTICGEERQKAKM